MERSTSDSRRIPYLPRDSVRILCSRFFPPLPRFKEKSLSRERVVRYVSYEYEMRSHPFRKTLNLSYRFQCLLTSVDSPVLLQGRSDVVFFFENLAVAGPEPFVSMS